MAEDYTSTDYGALGSGVSIRNLDKWAYTPFYKRNVFTGINQAEQAANLLTSPSFTEYWSQGGSQADNTSLVRVSSTPRDVFVNNNMSKYEYRHPRRIPSSPTRPTPPSGIRNIEWFMGGPRMSDAGTMIPVEMESVWPELTAEEKTWWDDALKKHGKKTEEMARIRASNSNVPIEIRNIRGALPLEERRTLSLLNYHTNEYGQTRMVNASSPSNLLGVASELEDHVSVPARAGLNKTGRFSPTLSRASGISYLSTTSPDVALAVHDSRRLLDAGELIRLESEAAHSNYYPNINWGKKSPEPINITPNEFDDIAPVSRNPVAVPSQEARQARSVGRITRDSVPAGLGSNGQPIRDALPSTTTTIYGPPDKYAALRTAGKNAYNVAQTGFSYGMSGLALYGAIDAGMSVPARHEAYQRGGNNWLLSQAAAQSDAMLNFMTLGGWDAIEHGRHRGGTRGDYRGEMSNIQAPRLGLINEQSVHANPNRYERQGVSLDHALSLFR
jgi:hypothetical protein